MGCLKQFTGNSANLEGLSLGYGECVRCIITALTMLTSMLTRRLLY